ncbi:GNAT family N-acetyltransferase [Corticibacterium sp. UT-5YL-CI-8]|nr:GNAT family N-acetyltransferase [Tianweitania sp. UT-5YL-CI-8]
MLEDLRALFRRTKATDGCWCMWYIISVRDYHAGRGAANQRLFTGLMRESDRPMGLLAYVDGDPAGWIALGPRSRFARALGTPTLQGRDPREDALVWLVTCFFVAREHRRKGLAGSLLDAAIELARRSAAKAIEGFPTQGHKIASTDSQVGTEQMFAERGFEVVRRPSSNRVIVRLDL